MKYKVGDMFVVDDKEIVDILRVIPDRLMYEMSDGVFRGDKKIDLLITYRDWINTKEIIEPKPWRDGSVEQPVIGDHIRYVNKRYPKGRVSSVLVGPNDICWVSLLWIPEDEFEKLLLPMPAIPEVKIKNCPFCGKDSMIINDDQTGDMEPSSYWLYCENADCNYVSGAKETEQEAIDGHNELCKKVKE